MVQQFGYTDHLMRKMHLNTIGENYELKIKIEDLIANTYFFYFYRRINGVRGI